MPLSDPLFAIVLLVGTLLALIVLRWMVWRNERALWRFEGDAPTHPPSAVGQDADESWPSVSIIVPARDEAERLPQAIAAWERLDYPGVKVVLVNDHSSDATGDIMDDAARRHPDRFRVLHDPPLPAGWLGKNNALWQAAQASDSDWLLMTDADIVFAPDVLPRAVGLALERGVELLPAFIRVEAHSLGERVSLPFLCALGMAGFPISSGMNPKSRDAMGVGGFTLVRRDAYFRVGGHAAIASEVVEDVEFARLCKRSGVRYGIADGTPYLSVRMYESLAAVVRGFRKNTFAALERNVALAALAAFVIVLVGVLPAAMFLAGIAMLALPGITTSSALAWCASGAAGWMATSRFVASTSGFAISAPRFGSLLHPVGASATILIVILSTWDGLVRRRIIWRGRTLRLADIPNPTSPPADLR